VTDPGDPAEAPATPPAPVLAETAAWLAVDKPAGIAVIPARGEPFGDSLRARLESARGERLWVVHRLDRETSGVVLFARTAEAHRALSLAFERREVAKEYRAFTDRSPEPARGTVDAALHDARRGRSRPAREGEPGSKPATTAYRTLRRYGGDRFAELALEPATGRHHQLRVHLRSIGTPILFDPVYGREVVELADAPAHRLALHATRLAFADPVDGGARTIEAPLAADLVAFADWLAARFAVDLVDAAPLHSQTGARPSGPTSR
jgi:RluA family pseudouridine synthase